MKHRKKADLIKASPFKEGKVLVSLSKVKRYSPEKLLDVEVPKLVFLSLLEVVVASSKQEEGMLDSLNLRKHKTAVSEYFDLGYLKTRLLISPKDSEYYFPVLHKEFSLFVDYLMIGAFSDEFSKFKDAKSYFNFVENNDLESK